LALWPEAEWVWFDRGLAALGDAEYSSAIADFDRAVSLAPEMAEAFANRGLAHFQAGEPERAVADFSKALDLGAPATRLYFMRARARRQQGDVAGAEADFNEGLKRTPTDEASWIARGLARLAEDPSAALADFDQALALNSSSRAALEDKAHVLSERLGKTEEAIALLDQVVDLHPDYVLARAGRGVLLSRLGRREAALADAQQALRRDTRPANVYQVAGIYAQTSRQVENDRLEAYRLLSLALRQGFGLDLVGIDPDLAPLRGRPEFDQLIEAAKTLVPSKKATPQSQVN
jgi:tetratricopeptide (TPR) repeat protein